MASKGSKQTVEPTKDVRVTFLQETRDGKYAEIPEYYLEYTRTVGEAPLHCEEDGVVLSVWS